MEKRMKHRYLVCVFALGLLVSGLWMTSCSKGDSATGEACGEKSDCRTGLCLMETVRDAATGWTDGYCSDTCTKDTDCSGGCSCRRLGTDGYCLVNCELDSDCRNGYVCNPTWLVCLPDCHNQGWDCGEGLECLDSGHCDTPAPVTYIGLAREAAEDCESDLCIPDQDEAGNATYWSAGYCSLLCPEGTECPDGSSCYGLADAFYCLLNCETDDGCREGYICDTDWLACLPDCRLGWPCTILQICEQESGMCVLYEDQPVSCDLAQPDHPCCGNEFCEPVISENALTCPVDCDLPDGDIDGDVDDTQPDGDEQPVGPVPCVEEADCDKPDACPPGAAISPVRGMALPKFSSMRVNVRRISELSLK